MDETRNDAPLTGEAPQTAKPQPLRRVGSFTLGVCLIAAGIFFLLTYFVPGVDWKLMLKDRPGGRADPAGRRGALFCRPPGPLEIRFLVGADLPCAHGRMLWPFAAAGDVG